MSSRRYVLRVRRSAAKELARLTAKQVDRIARAISRLAAEPRPPGCKKIQGQTNMWRLPGDYRILYTVDDSRVTVEVVSVAHRRDAYR